MSFHRSHTPPPASFSSRTVTRDVATVRTSRGASPLSRACHRRTVGSVPSTTRVTTPSASPATYPVTSCDMEESPLHDGIVPSDPGSTAGALNHVSVASSHATPGDDRSAPRPSVSVRRLNFAWRIAAPQSPDASKRTYARPTDATPTVLR